jgi:magnesium transporter
MLNAFVLEDQRLRRIDVESLAELESLEPVWIDLLNPTEEESGWVQAAFHFEMPEDMEDVANLETSTRFFGADGSLNLRTIFLQYSDWPPEVVPVGIVLKDGRLLTVREEELSAFRLFRRRARSQPDYVASAIDVLTELHAMDVEYSASILHGIYLALEDVSQWVLKEAPTDAQAEDVLAQISQQEGLNGKVRLSLMDTRRSLSFLLQSKRLTAEQANEARQVLKDIDSLDGHTAFLFDKINFLMDATMGFININQNKIIKIFSIASVVFLPPTLIASVYGMNFEWMPELHHQWGYPAALGVMVLSGIAPYVFFKWKGWF